MWTLPTAAWARANWGLGGSVTGETNAAVDPASMGVASLNPGDEPYQIRRGPEPAECNSELIVKGVEAIEKALDRGADYVNLDEEFELLYFEVMRVK